MENQRLVEDNKGAYNIIRAKDAELDSLTSRGARSDQVGSGVEARQSQAPDLPAMTVLLPLARHIVLYGVPICEH